MDDCHKVGRYAGVLPFIYILLYRCYNQVSYRNMVILEDTTSVSAEYYYMIRTDYKVALLSYNRSFVCTVLSIQLEQPLTKSPSTIVHLYANVR
jgi:hypothetical protein